MSKVRLGYGGTISRLPVWRVIAVQMVAIGLLGAGTLAWRGQEALFAALAGGMIETLARAWFGFWAFRHVGASHAHLVLKAFRRGEAGKFVVVAVSFGLLFSLQKEVAVVWVLVGYVYAWVVGTVMTAILVSRYQAARVEKLV